MLIKKSQAILKRFIDLEFSVGLRWAKKTKPCFVTLFSRRRPVKIFKPLNDRQSTLLAESL